MSYIIKYFYNFYSSRHCIYIMKNTKEYEASRLHTNFGKNLQLIFILGRTPRNTKQVGCIQISVKIYSTYLHQEEHQGNEASRLHTNFGQNLQHIFILGRTPRNTKQVGCIQISVKIYSTYLHQEEHQGNEASRLHTNFGQNLQHIFILGRTPRKTAQVGCIQTSVKIYSTYLY